MIRVAVIGAGQWGASLIRNFHNKETSEVVWIIDRDATRLDGFRHSEIPEANRVAALRVLTPRSILFRL